MNPTYIKPPLMPAKDPKKADSPGSPKVTHRPPPVPALRNLSICAGSIQMHTDAHECTWMHRCSVRLAKEEACGGPLLCPRQLTFCPG
eukprot:1157886-Pelagomonas_calceolata.AAC.3